MKVVVLQEDLIKTLSIVSRFVSPRSQLPVLSNILLSIVKGKLKIAATNLEMGVSLQIGAKTEKEGAITVPARMVTDLVSSLPSGQISLEEKQGQLLISTPSFSGALTGVPASEFPSVPEKVEKVDFYLPQGVLQTITKQVVFSSAIDEGRPVLTGVLFWFGEKLRIVATDGFRLSYKEIVLDKGVNKGVFKDGFKLIVPAKAIDELSRILGSSTDDVGISILEQEKQLIFSGDSAVLTSKLLEGEFPDFEKIIPQGGGYQAIVDKGELERAVKSASVFAREAASLVKVKFTKDGLVVTAESQQYGKDEVVVEAKTEGGELEVAYNYRYILEFLGSVNNDVVSIQTESSTSPSVFRDTKDASYTHLIMPVRIQS